MEDPCATNAKVQVRVLLGTHHNMDKEKLKEAETFLKEKKKLKGEKFKDFMTPDQTAEMFNQKFDTLINRIDRLLNILK